MVSSLPSVPKGNTFFLDGFLTTRHFHVSHFIKLPNVIKFYPDIISLSKTSIKLEKKRIVRKLTGGTVGQQETPH